MQNKTIGYIYETRDYDQFGIINGNRSIDHSAKISKSIEQNGALLSPIIVNEKMQIIDGQNRFAAFKEHNLPIQYIIAKGYGINEVRTLNESARNWSIPDYIESFAAGGNEGCIRLLAFMDRYKNFINKSSLLEIAAGYAVRLRHISEFRTFDFKNEPHAIKVAEALIELKSVDINEPPVYARRDFARAMCKVMKVEGFELAILIRKIKAHPRKLVPCGNCEQYIEMLEEIYNFRNRKPLHLDF